MKKIINLKESLLSMDKDTDGRYDLTNLYEACNLDDKKKRDLAKYITAYDIEGTNKFLSNEASSMGLMENTTDDLSDEEFEAQVTEGFIHMTDETTCNPLVMGANLKAGDLVYDEKTGNQLKVLSVEPNSNWSRNIQFINTTTNEPFVDIVGNNSFWEVVVEGDTAYEVDDDIDIEFHPIDELTSQLNEVVDEDPVEENLLGNMIGSAIKGAGKLLGEDLDAASIEQEVKDAMYSILEPRYDTDFVNDYCSVNVEDTEDNVIVRVNAELEYDALFKLGNELNKVITKFDSKTYFEAETSGRLVAYIRKDQSDDIVDEEAVKEWTAKFNACKTRDELISVYKELVNIYDNGVITSGTIDTLFDVIDAKSDELDNLGESLTEDINNIEKVVSKYNDAFYNETENLIDCGSEKTCRAIAKELNIGPENTSNSPVAHVIYLDNGEDTVTEDVNTNKQPLLRMTPTLRREIINVINSTFGDIHETSEYWEDEHIIPCDAKYYGTIKEYVNTKDFIFVYADIGGRSSIKNQETLENKVIEKLNKLLQDYDVITIEGTMVISNPWERAEGQHRLQAIAIRTPLPTKPITDESLTEDNNSIEQVSLNTTDDTVTHNISFEEAVQKYIPYIHWWSNKQGVVSGVAYVYHYRPRYNEDDQTRELYLEDTPRVIPLIKIWLSEQHRSDTKIKIWCDDIYEENNKIVTYDGISGTPKNNYGVHTYNSVEELKDLLPKNVINKIVKLQEKKLDKVALYKSRQLPYGECIDVPYTYCITTYGGSKKALTVAYRESSNDFTVRESNPSYVYDNSRLRFLSEEDANTFLEWWGGPGSVNKSRGEDSIVEIQLGVNVPTYVSYTYVARNVAPLFKFDESLDNKEIKFQVTADLTGMDDLYSEHTNLKDAIESAKVAQQSFMNVKIKDLSDNSSWQDIANAEADLNDGLVQESLNEDFSSITALADDCGNNTFKTSTRDIRFTFNDETSASKFMDELRDRNIHFDELPRGVIKVNKSAALDESLTENYIPDDDDYDRIDRNGSDEERLLAAITYQYGVDMDKARKYEKELSDQEKTRALKWYDLRMLPPEIRLQKMEEPLNEDSEPEKYIKLDLQEPEYDHFTIGGKEVPYKSHEEAKAHLDDFNLKDYEEELYKYLKSKDMYPELYVNPDNTLSVHIEWGDWKHDHQYIDSLINNFFFNRGLILDHDMEVTEDDGSDTYSATHYYTVSDVIFSMSMKKDNTLDESVEHNHKYVITEGVFNDIKNVAKSVGNSIKNNRTFKRNVQPTIDNVKDKVNNSKVVNKVKDTADKVANSEVAQTVKNTDTAKGVKGSVNSNKFMSAIRKAKTQDELNTIVKQIQDAQKNGQLDANNRINHLFKTNIKAQQSKLKSQGNGNILNMDESVEPSLLENLMTVSFIYDPEEWVGGYENLEDNFGYEKEQLEFIYEPFNKESNDHVKVEIKGPARYVLDFQSKYSDLFPDTDGKEPIEEDFYDDDFTDEEMAGLLGGELMYCPDCGSGRYYDGHCYDCGDTEEINESTDNDEVLIFKRNVESAEDVDEIQDLIYLLSDGVAEDNCQTAFYENEDADLQTLKDAVITAIDVYLEDNDWLGDDDELNEGWVTSLSDATKDLSPMDKDGFYKVMDNLTCDPSKCPLDQLENEVGELAARYTDGNASPEYEGEDFYNDEYSGSKIYNAILKLYGRDSKINESVDEYSAEFGYRELLNDIEKLEETFPEFTFEIKPHNAEEFDWNEDIVEVDIICNDLFDFIDGDGLFDGTLAVVECADGTNNFDVYSTIEGIEATLDNYNKSINEALNDYRFEVSCNDGPNKVIRTIADNEDKAIKYVKNMYAQEHTTYADDRANKWVIRNLDESKSLKKVKLLTYIKQNKGE